MTSLLDPVLCVYVSLLVSPISPCTSVSLCASVSLPFSLTERARTHTRRRVSATNAKMSPKKQVQQLALEKTQELVEKSPAVSSPLLPCKVRQGLGSGVIRIWPVEMIQTGVNPSPSQDPVAVRNPSLPRAPRKRRKDRTPQEGRAAPRFPGVSGGRARECAPGGGRRGRRGCTGPRPRAQPIVPPLTREAATKRGARDT